MDDDYLADGYRHGNPEEGANNPILEAANYDTADLGIDGNSAHPDSNLGDGSDYVKRMSGKSKSKLEPVAVEEEQVYVDAEPQPIPEPIIRYVEIPNEVLVEVPFETIKQIEVIREVPVEKIVEVQVKKIVEVPIEV
jgi:hypothetical protein